MGGRGAHSKHRTAYTQSDDNDKTIEQLKNETGADEVIIKGTQYNLKDFKYNYNNKIAQELMLNKDEVKKIKKNDPDFYKLYKKKEIHEKIAIARDYRDKREPKLIEETNTPTFDAVTKKDGIVERTEYKHVENDNFITARKRLFEAIDQQANRIVLDGFSLSTKHINQVVSEFKNKTGGKLLYNIEIHWLNTTFIFRKEE